MQSNCILLILFIFRLTLGSLIPCDCKCNTSIGIVKKYVDYLPNLKVLRPDYKDRHVDKYSVRVKEIYQKVHRDRPEVAMYGYEGSYPGPLVIATQDKKVEISWINRLPNRPLISINDTGAKELEEMLGLRNVPANRIVTHLHGGRQSNSSDGLPLEFYGPGSKKKFTYPNKQSPTVLLYHDHAFGITRVNVYLGLLGAYLIRNHKIEKELNLPRSEIPLIIQDKLFQNEEDDLKLFLPFNWVPEIFGDVILVNGRAWPYIEVEPKKYRIIIANGCDARYLNLRFIRDIDDTENPGVIEMIQIGGDQGFLDSPVTITELLLAPAERADIIVDFSQMRSTNLILFNNAPAPYAQSKMPPHQAVSEKEACSSSQIMKFRVKRCVFGETSGDEVNYSKFSEIAKPSLPSPIGTKTHVLEDKGTQLLIDSRAYLEPPIAEDFVNFNETYDWKFVNCGPDNHPMHIHLVEFRIIQKQNIIFATTEDCLNGLYTLGDIEELDDNEALAWKDTVRAPPGMITTVRAKFEQFCGKYVFHCHILGHEDNDMMRNYFILGENCL